MPSPNRDLMSCLRVMVGAWRDDPRDDAELLARFAETRDQTAFSTLVGRHGALVWQTCRRLLNNTADTEDAFQSTFLALARKAGQSSIKSPAGWLYQVARRTALKTQAETKRRRGLEQSSQTIEQPEEKGNPEQTELYAAIDEELASLPERLRVPLLLRYLEGKNLEEVARVVGCSRRVVSERLARGESILRTKLERRGMTLGVVSIAALLGGTSGVPAVPCSLIENTSRAAVAFRAGTLTGASAEAAEKLLQALAVRGGVRTCWWALLASVCSLASFGTGLAIWKMIATRPDTLNAPSASVVLPTPITAVHSPRVDSYSDPLSVVLPTPITAVHSPRVDSYGDPLPEGALARLGTVRLRNTETILSLFFMPDSKVVISSTFDNLSMWEFPSGRRLQSLTGRKCTEGFATVNAVSADSKLAAIATQDGDVELFDPHACKLIGQMEGSPKGKKHTLIEVCALAFLPDGKTLVSGMHDNTVRFWNVATCKEIRRQEITLPDPKKEIKGMAFTPDVRTVAVGQENGIVRLLDLKGGMSIGDIKISDKESFISLAFSADGRKLATAGSDGQVMLWETASRKMLLRLMGCGGLQTVRLSPDGKVLAAWGNDEKIGKVHLWDAETGASLSTLTGSHGFGCCMAFSPDSKALVTGSLTQTLKLWDVSTGMSLSRLEGHEYGVNAIAFAPDGKSLASASGHGVVRHNKTSLVPILIWDIETHRLRRQQLECEPGDHIENASVQRAESACITYSPDGALLTSPGRDNENREMVWLWDAYTGKRIHTLNMPARSVAFAPDNKTLAIGNHQSETIELCEVATGKRLRTLEANDLEGWQNGGIAAVAFSADGRKLASVHSSGIAIWDADTGKQLHSLVIPLQGESQASVSSVAFSPDGRMLVSGGEGDKTLRLWETVSGQEILKIPQEDGGIQVAFSPDGRLIASTSEDEAIRLWDTVTGRQLHQFPISQGRVHSIVFSPDGKTLASGNQDTTVLIWDVAPWIEREKRPAVVSSDELQAFWSALADTDASKAYRALGKLVAASDRAVPLLAEQLRSAAMASQVATAVPQRVTRLLADLDSDDFQVRTQSRKELQKMAYAAKPILLHALKGSLSPEQRQSVEGLLNKWNMNSASPKLLRRLRGVAVLEYIGTDAARQVLQELAKAPVHDEIGEEAQSALQRLNQRPH